jgi:hypothetical protein
MPLDTVIVSVSTSSKDRHHIITVDQQLSPSSPSKDVDFTYAPFNRGDRYSSTLYVSLDNQKKFEEFENEIKNITPSTNEAVIFSPMPSIGESISRIASGTTLSFAGFTFEITPQKPIYRR